MGGTQAGLGWATDAPQALSGEETPNHGPALRVDGPLLPLCGPWMSISASPGSL